MTLFCSRQIPSIFFKKPEDLLTFIQRIIKELLSEGKTARERWSSQAK